MKKAMSFFTLLVMLVFLPKLVGAEEVNTIIDLPRNDSTNFSMLEKNDLTSIIDENDKRIYRVSLGMNPYEKFTIVSQKTFDIVITDSDGVVLAQRTGFGVEGNRQVEFPTSKVEDYYIYITPSNDEKNQYPYSLRVIAGEPVYFYYNNYTVNLNSSSITKSSPSSSIQTINLTNISEIPSDAILTSFTVYGQQIGRENISLYSLKRSIRPSSSYSWIDAGYSLFTTDKLDYVAKDKQVRMKQSFSFKHSASFTGTGTYTLQNPSIKFSYKREMK
jgi:hypothetical protein